MTFEFIDFKNIVCFVASSYSTADFVAASPYTNCRMPSQSSLICSYFAESKDGTQYESGDGSYSVVTRTLIRTTVFSSSNLDDSKVDFAVAPIVAVWGSTLPNIDVTDFGAVGDGVTDCWQAIENANKFLELVGGGRMFFPSGTYKLPTMFQQIVIRDNVEYCGEGPATKVLGTNCAFTTKANSNFTWSTAFDLPFYPMNNLAIGDNQVTLTSPSNAANFKVGDMIMVTSNTAIVPSAGTFLAYFFEINRVTSVNVGTGVIGLEDPVSDGWVGCRAYNVTSRVSRNFSIHDMTISSALVGTAGQGDTSFLGGAWYKSTIFNLWINSYAGVVYTNGMVRSTAHDIIANVISSDSIIEIEYGSHNSEVYNIQVHVSGDLTFNPPIYLQENTRRNTVRDVQIYAPRNTISVMFGVQCNRGHIVRNITVHAKQITKVGDLFSRSPTDEQLTVPTVFENIITDVSTGYVNGWVLAGLGTHPNEGTATDGQISNITIRDCYSFGPAISGPIPWIWFFQGSQKNITFDNVVGPGYVTCNTLGLSFPDFPDIGTMTYPLTNIAVKNCEFTYIANQTMLQNASWLNNRRSGDLIPHPKYWPSTLVWQSLVGGTNVLFFTIPPTAKCCWGDAIRIKASARMGGSIAGLMHIAIWAFGVQIILVNSGAVPVGVQNIDIDITVTLANGSFIAPDKWGAAGIVLIDGVSQPITQFLDTFNLGTNGTVSIQAWVDNAPLVIVPKMASITYVPVENRAQAGI